MLQIDILSGTTICFTQSVRKFWQFVFFSGQMKSEQKLKIIYMIKHEAKINLRTPK